MNTETVEECRPGMKENPPTDNLRGKEHKIEEEGGREN
jgi:hypothetical protein